MERPADLFDRVTEWADLVDFASSGGPGVKLAIVRGRRRQGKSFLLRRLTEATGGFYFQALEQERTQALASIGEALGRHAHAPGGRLTLANWEDALAAIGELPPGGQPTVAVIDEFPYLLEHSPDLPSVIQRFVDERARSGPPIRLILCGSALSIMAGLLEGTKALRGRASTDVVVRPFDYRTAASYWGITRADTAFLVDAILGGTPGYRDLVAGSPPNKPTDLPRWLASGPLNPASTLFREDAYLLTEERVLSDRSLYHSVVSAIAHGNTNQAAIARALGREQRSVQHPLRSLVEAGFVVGDDDLLRSRRPIYRIADPIVRFHHVVTRPDMARFEDRRTADAWVDSGDRFRSQVLGPHFEHIAREFTFRFASETTVGGRLTDVGSAVLNDAARRSQHQIDVVAIGRSGGERRVLCLGEAKHSIRRLTLSELNRLEVVREAVRRREPSAESAKLLLFSATGFERSLEREAGGRSDVELVGLDRLYEGD